MTNTELMNIREARNLSKKEFGDLIGVTAMMVGRYEKGSCAIPEEVEEKVNSLFQEKEEAPAEETSPAVEAVEENTADSSAEEAAAEEPASIGDKIKALRIKLELTGKAFSEKTGIDRGSLSKFENGKVVPGEKAIGKICDVFGDEWLGKIKEAVEEKAVEIKEEAPVVAEEVKDEAVEAVKEAASEAIDVIKNTAKKISEKTSPKNRAKQPRMTKETAKAAVGKAKKKASQTVYIESLMGGQITVEEILKKVPEGTGNIYVKPEENKAYFEGGSVDLW